MTKIQIHPLDLLAPGEIDIATATLRDHFPGKELYFKKLDLQHAPKSELVPFLEAERLSQEPSHTPPRYVRTLFSTTDEPKIWKVAVVRLHPPEVVSVEQVHAHYQPPADKTQMRAVAQAILKDPLVKAEVELLKLPEGYTVWTDAWPWIDAEGKENPGGTLKWQGYLYANESDHPGASYYSLPLPISVIIDNDTLTVEKIVTLPLRDGAQGKPTEPWKKVKAIQHDPDLIEAPMRTNLKPYIVKQPEGPSFTVEGNLVTWQKWRFRVGFHSREGLFLQNISYDGRNTFHRLSIPEMSISYGDPRRPYSLKQAFDAGDSGFGYNANQLKLGCDCLGHIHYMDAYSSNTAGEVVEHKSFACLHEQDAGLLHKHTNNYTGAITIARNRQLVVQMIATLGNYEYVFAYIFDQAAGIDVEVRATGILATSPIDNSDGFSYRWGTNVGPNVFAANHQHLFSLRVDPAIDGYNNTIVYDDTVPMAFDEDNQQGVGFVAETNVVNVSTALDLDVNRHRVFKIRNDNIINKITGKPIAYKILTLPSQMMLANPASSMHRRAIFASRPVWVTKYKDEEMFPEGDYSLQGFRDNDVKSWVDRQDQIVNKDVVFWHTFTLTHVPRPEDFPLMPFEKCTVELRPSGFFDKSPALDVPRSIQAFNQSVSCS